MISTASYEQRDDYIYDYDTSNASFIKIASLLRKRGIKNYKFMLKLYDEDLVGVDPFDPKLSIEIKLKVANECRRNFWYFIREVMIIPGTGRFILHRGNLAGAWAIDNNLYTYLVLPRQHGKTWLIISYALWMFNFSTNYSQMLFLNKQLTDSRRNLQSLKNARSVLPDYLRMNRVENSKGDFREINGNQGEITNGLNNTITAKASARSDMAAEELGRGMSIAWFWIDELGFVMHNRTIYSAMAPAWSKASEIAKKQGKPVGKILTTTPGDIGTEMGKFAHEIKEHAGRFTEDLYDKSPDNLIEWMKKNSENDYLYIEYQYYQLGHEDPPPDEWYKKQCKDLLFDWPKIRREILLNWSSASANSPFDDEDLRDLQSIRMEPIESENITINSFYTLNVYRHMDPNDKYLISVDVAKGRGAGADRTVVCVTDAKTNMCHAIFKSSIIQYKETYRFIYTLVTKHIPNVVIIIENNIDTLIEYIKESSLRSLLYYERPRNAVKEKRVSALKKRTNNDIVYGVNTNADSRPKYFDILFEYVRSHQEYINCAELIEEINTLVYKTPTRIEAMSGTHDDVIFAYLIGQYIMQFGTNKAAFRLFYSADGDDDEPVNNVDKNVFAKSYLNGRPEYDNPFFNEFMQYQQDAEEEQKKKVNREDEQESRWRNQLNSLEQSNDVFVDNDDEESYGLHVISKDAFNTLNSRKPSRTPIDFSDINSGTSQESRGGGGLNDFSDNPRDSWF